jgi:Tfp pilus assembly protein PilX
VKHGGMAMVAGLVLLAALTALAMLSANSMAVQRLQAANYEDRERARQNALHAERAGMAWINSRSDHERQAGCVHDCLLPVAILPAGSLPANLAFESAAWWHSHGHESGVHPLTGKSFDPGAGTAEPPRWLVEEVYYQAEKLAGATVRADAVGYYRLISRASGKRKSSIAVTELILARPWEGDYSVAPYPPDQQSPGICEQFSQDISCGVLSWRQIR